MSEEYKNFGAINRQQKNVNPLLDNKFTFSIVRLPETSWSCKAANIPGTSIPVAIQTSTQNPIPRAGLNVEYEPLEIDFIVDEDLNNYCELVNWMRLMAMPVDSRGNSQLKLQNLEPGPDGLVSDAELVVLNNESLPNFSCMFRDAFPTRLSALRFTSDTENPQELIATVTFTYSWFDLATIESQVQPE